MTDELRRGLRAREPDRRRAAAMKAGGSSPLFAVRCSLVSNGAHNKSLPAIRTRRSRVSDRMTNPLDQRFPSFDCLDAQGPIRTIRR
jgi:hypothetical protein